MQRRGRLGVCSRRGLTRPTSRCCVGTTPTCTPSSPLPPSVARQSQPRSPATKLFKPCAELVVLRTVSSAQLFVWLGIGLSDEPTHNNLALMFAAALFLGGVPMAISASAPLVAAWDASLHLHPADTVTRFNARCLDGSPGGAPSFIPSPNFLLFLGPLTPPVSRGVWSPTSYSLNCT